MQQPRISAKWLRTMLPKRFRKKETMSTVVGWVDSLNRGSVRGWAIDTAQPTRRVIIELVAGSDEVIRRVIADRYRADVHKHGYGDGCYGFSVPAKWLASVPTPRFFCAEPRVELSSVVSTSSGKKATTLQYADLVLHLDTEPAPPCITGWAFNRRHPNERRQLRLRTSSQVLAVQKATLFRPDTVQEGGDGFHGFYLPLLAEPTGLFIDDVTSGSEFRISWQ